MDTREDKEKLKREIIEETKQAYLKLNISRLNRRLKQIREKVIDVGLYDNHWCWTGIARDELRSLSWNKYKRILWKERKLREVNSRPIEIEK